MPQGLGSDELIVNGGIWVKAACTGSEIETTHIVLLTRVDLGPHLARGDLAGGHEPHKKSKAGQIDCLLVIESVIVRCKVGEGPAQCKLVFGFRLCLACPLQICSSFSPNLAVANEGPIESDAGARSRKNTSTYQPALVGRT